jgi:hypothetical protein
VKDSKVPVGLWAAVIVGGLLVGSASALWTMKRGGLAAVGGGWQTSQLAGAIDADPWTRARVALTGLLALNRSQAIYFTTATDSSGARLDEKCRYRVSGGPLPGRWWSVTVYADDDYLPQNDDNALSFDATRVHPDATGAWQALVAARRDPVMPDGAWASSNRAGKFTLTLRLYNPAASARANSASVPLPLVTRLDCGGQA